MTKMASRVTRPVSVASLAVALALAFTLFAPSKDAERIVAYGHGSASFSGKVTVDGEPAPAGTQVIVSNGSGDIFGSSFTGANDSPADQYSIIVPESSAPVENSIVTVTLSGEFAEVLSVDIRYVYFGLTGIADIAAFTTPVPPVPEAGDGEAFISLSPFVNISPTSTATSGTGQSLRVIGGSIRMDSVGSKIAIPVSLLSGTLETLDDPVSGVTIRRIDDQMLVRIPFMDADGNDTIRVLVDAAPLSGKGFSASGEILGLRIDAPTRSRDFSQFDRRVATGSVKVLGNITSYPGNSLLEMRMVPEPSPSEVDRLNQALAERTEQIADVAYSVDFEKTGLEPVLGRITLRLTVGKEWIDAQEPGSVIVARLADDGSNQFFPFVPIDAESDPVRFDLESPDGLSAFIITAVREANPPTPTPEPTATPTPEPTATVAPRAVPSVSPSPSPSPTAALTISPSVRPTATNAAVPTATSDSVASPLSTATGAVATVATSGSPSAVEGAPEEASGGLCNAPVDGHLSAGQLALMLSPLILLAIKSRRSR